MIVWDFCWPLKAICTAHISAMPPLPLNRWRRSLALLASVAGLHVLIPALDGAAKPLLASAIDPAFAQQVLGVIRRHPEVLNEALTTYESEQQVAKLREQGALLRRLYPRPSDLIGNSPTRGVGKVIMVEFSDFQCPYCATAHKAIQAFLERRGNDVTFVYKHFPLTQIHPQALPAARAAWAAGRQGQFWAYHDALFANQARLGEPLYTEIATRLKLDLSRFDQDRKGPGSLKAIQTDLDQAERLGLSGTPTLVMDQQFLMGPVTVAELEKQLNQASTERTTKPNLQGAK
jgi:protein-disulfide isomerase